MRVKKLYEDAKLPEYKTDGAAGLDLYFHHGEWTDGELYRVWTGIAVALPHGTVGRIVSRSSMFRDGWIADGTIDQDYRGEVIVQLRCVSSWSASMPKPGDRVAQLLVLPVHRAVVTEVDELDDTARGTGGFGSTGK